MKPRFDVRARWAALVCTILCAMVPAVAQEFRAGGSVKSDISPPLRSIVGPTPGEIQSQTMESSPLAPPTSLNFPGLTNIDGVLPPDTNGDVGPNHYVQVVNHHFQIFNKAGVSVYGPASLNALWLNFGLPCEGDNDGDPVVLYDSTADRWVLSEFVATSPFYGECIAVSTGSDPAGSYYRYYFNFSPNTLYDFPQMGVWPDGYYMGANRFNGATPIGPAAIVLDRGKMLAGQASATYQEFDLNVGHTMTLLPADVDGDGFPAVGPEYFATPATNEIDLYSFHVDWGNPSASTFVGPHPVPVPSYTPLCPGLQSCIVQPSSSVKLDGLGDRLMHRLAYRNFGDHASLVTCQSVGWSPAQAGVRWYELRLTPPGTMPSLFQQGTFSPDATNRWLGSIAMDRNGDIALGYSVSSATVFPGIRYTGRLAGDPLGQMPQGESVLLSGGASQADPRWGLRAAMSVDPADDCTFWFTSEYIQPGTGDWRTRIGAFRFPSCVASACSPPNCDDGNPCTDDFCDAFQGCMHNNNASACNDGNACTQNDICQNGTCTGMNPVTCTPLDQCHVPGTCNPVNGQCSNPNAPNGASCTDGNACTQADSCQNGTCSGVPVPPPAEVNSSLVVTKSGNTASILWTDAAGPFNVYRGQRQNSGSWTYNQTCLVSNTGSPASDSLLRSPGEASWYLVTRRSNCGESVPGRDSSGMPIPNPQPCP